jgi:hypothetical protein
MDIIILVLLIAGALLFGLAALKVASEKIDLVALGLLMWIMVPLILQIDGLR